MVRKPLLTQRINLFCIIPSICKWIWYGFFHTNIQMSCVMYVVLCFPLCRAKPGVCWPKSWADAWSVSMAGGLCTGTILKFKMKIITQLLVFLHVAKLTESQPLSLHGSSLHENADTPYSVSKLATAWCKFFVIDKTNVFLTSCFKIILFK